MTQNTVRYAGCLMAGLLLPMSLIARTSAERPASASALTTIVDDAVRYQLEDLKHEGWAVRYRVHRTDSKEDSVRQLIETADGNVARTLQRNGDRLSPEQDAAEQQRIRALTPDEMEKHRHRSEPSDHYGVELITAMPAAMTYHFTPGQPQLAHVSASQIVLDFEPRPDFHPASTAQSLLTGLAGRLWIDETTHHLLHIDVRVTKNLNLAFGLLARVYQGGTMTYEQVPVGNGHDVYRYIDINVVLRELMVKTTPFHSTLEATDIQLLPSVPSMREAVDALLAPGTAR